MKATLEVQHQAWSTLMDAAFIQPLKETALRIIFMRVKDQCAKFEATIDANELSEGELRTIKRLIPKLTFEKASWEDTQHAVGTIVLGAVNERFNKIELKITLRRYMTCTPDNADTELNRATPAQMDKLEAMFLEGKVKLHNCTLLTEKLERCKSRGCADEAFAGYDGYCYGCHGELQHDLAAEDLPAIDAPPSADV